MSKQYLDAVSIFAIGAKPKQTFTAATTDIITSNAHGLSDGDMVVLTNSGGALPAGLSAATRYYVISSTTNTFKLSTTKDGTAVDVTGTGTGTHSYQIYGKIINVEDFQHLVVSLDTANSANFTVKFQGSISDTEPDFLAAQSATNSYDYVQIVDIQSGSSINGDTGIAPAGTDDNRMFEINTNGLKWITANFTAYTAGNLQIKVKPFNNQ